MSKGLLFRLAARCEAAGRPNNEDNFQVDADLSKGDWQFNSDEIISLIGKGALLLVCDGMGGMNAGEVASRIAVDTVKQRFSKDGLENGPLVGDEQRCSFIKSVIQEADANIKKESNADEAKRGMGSTIVLAWLIDEKVYVGWCGDSRAYKYNPSRGFVQLSHDHSYVQELVDAGKLSPELAFDHPNNNIITRSLGDPRGVAQPDVKVFSLEEYDVIMLCSDGLCGVLRDHEMEQLISGHQSSMVSCRDALWEAARNAGWHDNVTIALAQIMPQQAKPQVALPSESKPIEKPIQKDNYKKYLKIGLAVLVALLVVLAMVLVYKHLDNNSEDSKPREEQPKENRYCEQLKNKVDLLCDRNFNLMSHPDILDEIDVIIGKMSDLESCGSIRKLKEFCENYQTKGMTGEEEVCSKIDEIKEKLK